MQMNCPSCKHDIFADVVGDQSMRFQYVCPRSDCRANLGPVKKDAALISTAVPVAILKHNSDPIEQLRAELVAIENRLTADVPRRAILKRLLAAADRPARGKRTNVVHFARKATS